mmetsp:Transcript_22182/g.63273  ORF Transcript_22182/g.63273 Transcript_22182/m.63273 type:complete len:187 (+) Transcript_22182:686-1246(+)
MGNAAIVVEGTVTHRLFLGRLGWKEERAVLRKLNQTSLSEVNKAVHHKHLLRHKYLWTALGRLLDDDEAFLDYLQTHVRPESVQEWNEWAEEARQVMEADQEQREDTDVSGGDEVLPHIDDELLPTDIGEDVSVGQRFHGPQQAAAGGPSSAAYQRKGTGSQHRIEADADDDRVEQSHASLRRKKE